MQDREVWTTQEHRYFRIKTRVTTHIGYFARPLGSEEIWAKGTEALFGYRIDLFVTLCGLSLEEHHTRGHEIRDWSVLREGRVTCKRCAKLLSSFVLPRTVDMLEFRLDESNNDAIPNAVAPHDCRTCGNLRCMYDNRRYGNYALLDGHGGDGYHCNIWQEGQFIKEQCRQKLTKNQMASLSCERLRAIHDHVTLLDPIGIPDLIGFMQRLTETMKEKGCT